LDALQRLNVVGEFFLRPLSPPGRGRYRKQAASVRANPGTALFCYSRDMLSLSTRGLDIVAECRQLNVGRADGDPLRPGDRWGLYSQCLEKYLVKHLIECEWLPRREKLIYFLKPRIR